MSNKRVKRSMMIPYDVVEDILVRLPADSLIRFKSINKTLCSLIQNPTFSSKQLLHHRRHGDPASVILLPIRGNNVFILESPDHAPDKWDIPTWRGRLPWVVGHCNGLICFSTSERLTPTSDVNLYLNLWNPALGQQKTLPYSSLLPEPGRCMTCIEDDYLGFGQDRTSGDYKIVRFAFYDRVRGDERTRYVLGEVYSLQADSWRPVAHAPSLPPRTMWGGYGRGSSVCSGGSCYWVGLGSEYFPNTNVNVLSFDLSSEVFRLVNLPESVPRLLAEKATPYWHEIKHHFVAKPMMWNGSLCAVAFPRDPKGPKWVGIWVLDHVDDMLSVKKFSTVEFDESFDERRLHAELLWNDEMIFNSSPGMTCINMKTQKIKNISFDTNHSSKLTFQISGYIKSIVSPM